MLPFASFTFESVEFKTRRHISLQSVPFLRVSAIMNSFTSFEFAFVLIAFILVPGSLSCSSQPELNVYESDGYGNEFQLKARRIDTRVSVPDVTVHGITNNRLYHCESGVWLGYPEKGYEGRPSLLDYSWGPEPTCYPENTGRKFLSYQVVGSDTNSSVSTVNTFTGDYFQGVQATHFESRGRLDDAQFNSVIVMGAEPVELFTGANQNGMSVCVRPYLGAVGSYEQLFDGGNLQKSRGTYLVDLGRILGLPAGPINSYTIGCRSANKGNVYTIPNPATKNVHARHTVA